MPQDQRAQAHRKRRATKRLAEWKAKATTTKAAGSGRKKKKAGE